MGRDRVGVTRNRSELRAGASAVIATERSNLLGAGPNGRGLPRLGRRDELELPCFDQPVIWIYQALVRILFPHMDQTAAYLSIKGHFIDYAFRGASVIGVGLALYVGYGWRGGWRRPCRISWRKGPPEDQGNLRF